MEKTYQNFFAHALIKRQGVGTGSLRVFDWRDIADGSAPCLTLLVEIETSDKENEKIITALSETLSDQFFNAPTETVEFAFESALARANIAVKDTLLIKPKNWLNKIHVLAAAGRDQELHLSSVGRAHAFLVHRGQIVDVVATADGSTRTPNPVKLFSNIVSGRLLKEDALVVCNEAVLDYLSPERIRKTAQDFDPIMAVAKFNELLAAAPANRQFTLAIIKRLPLPVLTLSIAETPPARRPGGSQDDPPLHKIDKTETIVEKYLRPQRTGRFNRQAIKTAKRLGESAVTVMIRYAQIGLTAALSGLSKSLEVTQGKLTKNIPRLGRAPKFILTLWRDVDARHYHLSKFKTKWQARFLIVKRSASLLPPKQKKLLLAILAFALLFAGSVAWRAYDKSAAADKIAYNNNSAALARAIDQAEASLIYRDEARSRAWLNEIKALLATLPRGSNEARNRYHEFKTKTDNIQNSLDKKQVLGNLSAWLTVSSDNDQGVGFVKAGADYYYFNAAAIKIAKIDLVNSTLSDLPATNPIRPWRTVVTHDDNTLALVGAASLDLLDVKTGALTNQNLTPLSTASAALGSYAKNFYVLAPPDSIIRYRENESTNPQPWLKEAVDLSAGVDIAVDGQIYVLTESRIVVLGNGRLSSSINLALSEPLGQNARLVMEPDLNSLYVLDPSRERILHFSKTGDLYNQYISPDLKNAKAIMVDGAEKFVYVLAGDKIFRIAILPPA